ncbi:unnamed protein product [Symbiodinium natans]|uniref:Uncharacterized protein n=1 Tax=Symbiodinium natans TaxID=878477 RepID=A0A812LE14_9DINO|nr:unnamed protein product [Symbiodinium natans]
MQADENPLAEEYFRKALEMGDRRLLLSRVPKGRNTMHSAILGMDKAMHNGVADTLLTQIRTLPASAQNANPPQPEEPSEVHGLPQELSNAPCSSPSSTPQPLQEAPSESSKAWFESPRAFQPSAQDSGSQLENEEPGVSLESHATGNSELEDVEDMSDVQYDET